MTILIFIAVVLMLAWPASYLGDPETGTGSRVEYK